MSRTVDHVVAILAILRAGAACYSLSPKSTPAQVARAAEIARSRCLFIDDGALQRLAASDVLPDASWLHLGPAPPDVEAASRRGVAHVDSRAEGPRSPDTNAADLAPAADDDVAIVLFTSGSTGAPKGVMISHGDLRRRVARERADLALSPSDRLLGVLPFSFDVGLNQLFSAVTAGATLVLHNSWLPADLCSAVARHEITGISGVPSVWTSLMGYREEAARACLGALRYFTISGGDLARPRLLRLRELAPSTAIYKTYGQSETFRSALLRPSEYDAKIGSVGRAVLGTEIVVVTPDGRIARAGEPGEIVHSGDGTMLGYAGDPEGTRAKLRAHPSRPGALAVYTGDIGTLDDDGYLYVLGRSDRMLKILGHRAYPQEIAVVLESHPEVREAAVVGVRGKGDEHAICAEVVLVPGSTATVAAVRRFLGQRLPSHLVPAALAIVDDLPRTESGKVALAALEAKYDGGVG